MTTCALIVSHKTGVEKRLKTSLAADSVSLRMGVGS